MKKVIRILIVESEMIIAANISLQLSNLGYEISGILACGKDALVHINQNKPDIVLINIRLKGKMNGIETARLMQDQQHVSIIYLITNAADSNFAKAKVSHPYVFISKTYNTLELQRAIETSINDGQSNKNDVSVLNNSPFILSNCIFVRNNKKMVKVNLENILYVEAKRNYCQMNTNFKEFLLVITLKKLYEKLPPNHFLRIHRSYVVNISHIDEIFNSHVLISKKSIPISKPLKEELLNRLHTI